MHLRERRMQVMKPLKIALPRKEKPSRTRSVKQSKNFDIELTRSRERWGRWYVTESLDKFVWLGCSARYALSILYFQ